MNAPGRAATAQQPCTYQLGACGRTDTRPYQVGGRWRCPDHTPAKLAGNREPDAARYCLAICYCGGCVHRRRVQSPTTSNVVGIRSRDRAGSGKGVAA